MRPITCGHNEYGLFCAGCVLAFAEERVKEANELNRRAIEVAHKIVDGVKEVNDHILDVAKEARAEALEEASRFVMNLPTHPTKFSMESASIITNGIRALKSKP